MEEGKKKHLINMVFCFQYIIIIKITLNERQIFIYREYIDNIIVRHLYRRMKVAY